MWPSEIRDEGERQKAAPDVRQIKTFDELVRLIEAVETCVRTGQLADDNVTLPASQFKKLAQGLEYREAAAKEAIAANELVRADLDRRLGELNLEARKDALVRRAEAEAKDADKERNAQRVQHAAEMSRIQGVFDASVASLKKRADSSFELAKCAVELVDLEAALAQSEREDNPFWDSERTKAARREIVRVRAKMAKLVTEGRT